MINKTFRLFISSTFSDFLLERNLLNDEVFPVVDEYCQSRGYNFQLIDLRWGINRESALNQKTISICLEEVERCTTLSPRPNFLIMAGERYGWIPLPYQFNPTDYKVICSNASKDEKELLAEWYIYDSNEVGGCYYLKERTNEYIDDEVWLTKEKELYSLIVKLVDLLDDKTGRFDLYKMSATEHEIFAGLFDKLEQDNSVIALFRNGFPYKDESQERISNLKQRISERLYSAGCQENIINLEWNDLYRNFFVERISDILLKNIKEEIERLESIKDDETLLEIQFKRNNKYLNIDQTKITAIQNYVVGNDNKPLFVVGESGSGKSTILSEFVCQAKKPIFYSFFGTGENSYSLQDSLKEIFKKIKKCVNIKKDFDITKNNISEKVYEFLCSIPSKEKIVIILDGLDCFYDINEILESVFPEILPDNVKLIISIADQNVFERFYIEGAPELLIGNFDFKESYKSLETLLLYKNRCISTSKQLLYIEAAIEKGATPLQVKLLSEIVSGWHSMEKGIELPDNAEETALLYFTDMYEKYGHNKELFLYAMALVTVAPYGITEDELLKLLFRFERVREYFKLEDRYVHNLNKLPFVLWSRMFYDLKGCLALVISNGDIVVKFVHQIFYKVILNNFSEYCEQAQKILTVYYSEQENFINDTLPNKRKLMCLSMLLRKAGEFGELSELLSDLTFVDAMIKAGRIEEVISNITFLIERDKSQKIHLDLLRYLLEYKDLLSCYKGEFFTYFEPAKKKNRAIDVFSRKQESKTVFFPYSKKSKISWFTDGSMMAVYHRRYVYIYSTELYKELCKIYVAADLEKSILISKVIWLNRCTLAVVTNLNEIYIYSFEDGIPNKIGYRIFDEDCVKYSEKLQMLFFIKDSFIYSLNPFNGIENYKINLIELGKCSDVEFDVDSDNEEIVFRKKAV